MFSRIMSAPVRNPAWNALEKWEKTTAVDLLRSVGESPVHVPAESSKEEMDMFVQKQSSAIAVKWRPE